MKTLLLCVLGAFALSGCAPRTQETKTLPPQVTVTSNLDTYEYLLAPFKEDLQALGIQVARYQTFVYDGGDPDTFIKAINQFYRQYPGFCPLENAFFAASNQVQFMTLAGNNSEQVRGFLFDHSQKPKLTYGYIEGISSQMLKATVCETAN
jgi:hypothetical protein